jgi:rhomboid protease GluP
LCAAGTAAFAWSAWPALRDHRSYALEALLIPKAQIPRTRAEMRSKAGELLARYPRDPRSRLYQAQALIDGRDLAGAERELRAGLAEREVLEAKFNPEFEATLQGMLALVLTDRSQHAEAKATAQPACAHSAASFAAMREVLVKAKLCEK